MYTVDISDGAGVDAEFTVPSPVLALDLVLRAVRAGLAWRAAAGPAATPLTLPTLYRLAEQRAAEVEREAEWLSEVRESELRASVATLN